MSDRDTSAEADLAEFGYKQELDRRLSTTDLVVYGLVFMVPIAPWAIFGVVFNASSGMVPLVYVIGLIAMIFTALSYAQMAKAFPIAGSVYSYVGRSIHPNLGFLAGWTIMLDYVLVPTLLYVIAAESMSGIFPGVPKWIWIVVFLAVNTSVNYLGISFTAIVNRIFLVAEVIFLAIFGVMAIVAISKGVNGSSFNLTPFFDSTHFTPGLIGTALSIAVLSFLGFDGIATLSEETRGGRKSAGIAMVSALIVVALFFITQTWLAALLVPDTTSFSAAKTNNAFFGIVQDISSHPWQVAFLVMNALAVGLANAVAAQSATSRLLFSMSRDRRLPAFLSHVDPRTKVPVRAILLVAAITLVLGLFFVGQIGLISSLVNFGALTAFLLLHVSVVIWYVVKGRARGQGPNWFLHLVSPVIGFCVIAYVLINAETNAKVGGLVWLVIGIGVLFFYRSRGIDVREEHAATSANAEGLP